MSYIENVFKNEENFFKLFSEEYTGAFDSLNFENGVKPRRFYDDRIKDMYDHNFTLFDGEFDERCFPIIENIKKQRGEGHIQILCKEKSPFLADKGFEEEKLLTMYKGGFSDTHIPAVEGLFFDDLRRSPQLIRPLVDTETEYYGKEYGEDFSKRRWLRYYDKTREQNGLNVYFAVIGGAVVGYCYGYYDSGVVAVDGLLVRKEYRNRYVASNLLKYISDLYGCPEYLHASDDETPKIMYEKMRFKTIDQTFYYLKKDI